MILIFITKSDLLFKQPLDNIGLGASTWSC